MSSLEFFHVQQKIIHDLMGSEWFSRPKNRICHHPAYKKYIICKKFISQGGIIHWPEDENLIKEFCGVILDSFDLVRSSGTKIDMFNFTSNIIGDFSVFGDEKSSSRIKSVINDPNLFSSLLAELAFAAWCFSKKYEVTPFEHDGYPDFKVVIAGDNVPIFVECKKLIAGYGKSRVSKIVSKANKQIKKTGEKGIGIVLIDATEIIDSPSVFSDEIPEKVEELEGYIRRTISNKNSSISAAIIVWNDYVAMGTPSSSERMQFTFRRRQLLVHHQSPLLKLPKGHQLSKYGATISFGVNFTSRVHRNKISRNATCLCKSGKRYKHCCGKLT